MSAMTLGMMTRAMRKTRGTRNLCAATDATIKAVAYDRQNLMKSRDGASNPEAGNGRP
jgi:hypothetical protein